MLAAVTVPLTIHFARYAANRQVRWLAMLACGVALLALPAGVSRSGVLALAAALFVYMWNFKVRDLAAVVVPELLRLWAILPPFQPQQMHCGNTITNSEKDESILTRTADYAEVGDTFRAHPVFGLGFGASDPTNTASWTMNGFSKLCRVELSG